jgi:mannosyltransferase OCH1-like enzyme
MMKYMVLFHYGGMAVDLELLCTNNFIEQESLAGKELVLIEQAKSQKQIKSLSQGKLTRLFHSSFMAGIPRHPLWKACLRELYFQRYGPVMALRETVIARSTGSVIVSLCVKGLKLEEEEPSKIAILPSNKIDSRVFPSKKSTMIENKDSIKSYKVTLAIIVIMACVVLLYIGAKTLFVKSKNNDPEFVQYYDNK